jgi:DNA-binding XRE family transcriptional regulator
MARKHRFESEGLQHLYDRYVGSDRKKRTALERELAGVDVARKLYELRKAAHLTQAQLATKVGTSTSVISRLEDANYEGHSLAMLRRIAEVLGKRVRISFVDAGPATSPPRSKTRKKTAKTAW